MSRRLAAALASLLAAVPASAASLEEVPFPDTARMDPGVREQLEAARARLRDEAGAEAYGHCGRVFLLYDLQATAAACLRNAERLAPDEPRWPYHLASLHAQRGELEQAEEAYSRATELAPRELAPLVALGNVQLQRGDLAGARESFAAARRLSPKEPAPLYGLGLVAQHEGNAAAAARSFEDALGLAPGSGAIRYALAQALRRLGKKDEAAAHLAASRQEPVGYPDPWAAELRALDVQVPGLVARGVQLLAASRFAEAEADLLRAVEADPHHAIAWQHLAAAREGRGDLDGARAAYERAIALRPGAAAPQANLGSLLIRQGRVDEGIVWLERALASDPASSAARFNLAVALLDRSPARSLELLEAQRREHPGDLEVQHYTAVALAASGRPADAALAFRRVIEAAPGVAAPRLGEARALLATGDESGARRRLEEALVALPADEVVRLALVEVLASASRVEVRDGARALRLAEELAGQGASADREQALAMALAELARFAEAVVHQERALALAAAAGAPQNVIEARLAAYRQGRPLRSPGGGSGW